MNYMDTLQCVNRVHEESMMKATCDDVSFIHQAILLHRYVSHSTDESNKVENCMSRTPVAGKAV